jgi:hypothetical protein
MNLTVRILRGEFTKFRGLSDLAEEQEGYGECFSKCKLRRNQTVGSKLIRAIGSLAKSHFVDSRVEVLKPLYQDLQGHEIMKESKSSIRGRTCVGRSPVSGIQTSKVRKRIPSTSRVAKSQEDWDHPFKEDRWKRSRDLANSEVRKVRAQELGAPICEWRSLEIMRSVDSRWIQVMGGLLDQEPHHLLHVWWFGG